MYHYGHRGEHYTGLKVMVKEVENTIGVKIVINSVNIIGTEFTGIGKGRTLYKGGSYCRRGGEY